MSTLLEIVTLRGRRIFLHPDRIIAVTEPDDLSHPCGILVEGLSVQPVTGESADQLVLRLAVARGASCAEYAYIPSPVPTSNRHGLRVMPDGTPDRATGPSASRLIT